MRKVASATSGQETNIDLISLKGGAPMAATHDGAIANDDGEVVAYWASFLTQTVEGCLGQLCFLKAGALFSKKSPGGCGRPPIAVLASSSRVQQITPKHPIPSPLGKGADLAKLGPERALGKNLGPGSAA